MRSLLVAAVLAAGPALADVFNSFDEVNLSLSRRSLTVPGDADLHITDRTITARFGVKLEKNGQEEFLKSTAVSIGDSYLAKDAKGNVYRVWLRDLVKARFIVELHPLSNPTATVVTSALVGRYRGGEVRVNGDQARSAFGDLIIENDGTYRVGTSRGTWQVVQGRIHLKGAVAHWGSAEVSPDADLVTFRFQRGYFNWEVNFQRAVVAQTERTEGAVASVH